MGNRYLFLLRNTLLFIDFLVINNSFLFTLACFSPLPGNNGVYFIAASLFIINLLWLATAWAFNMYPKNAITGLEEVFRATWRTVLVHGVVVGSVYIFIIPGSKAEKLSIIIFSYALMSIFLLLSRFFLTYIVEFLIKKSRITKKIAVVGYNSRGIEVADWLSTERGIYSFEGFFDDRSSYGNLSVDPSGNVIGSIESCIQYAVENGIKEVYSTLMPEKHHKINRLIKQAEDNCVSLRFVPASISEIKGEYYLLHEQPFPVIGIRSEPLADIGNRWKKRIFDITFSLFVIVFVLSWLVPIIGILIKLETKGPVFFVQKRSGRYNDIFFCFKFRTMAVTNKSDLQQATKGDARITRIGPFFEKPVSMNCHSS